MNPLVSILFTALYANILKYKTGKYFLTDALNDIKAVITGI